MKKLALEKIHKINNILSESRCPHNGLMSGSLGLLYYYFHVSAILQDPLLQQKAELLLESVFEEVNGEQARLSGSAFSNGATGLAYTVNNLQQNKLIDFDINSEFADLDEFLFTAACEQMEAGEIDYLHGAMGAFHYFGSREQDPAINNYFNALAASFFEKAIPSHKGLFFTNYSLERLGANKADLGLAHGLSGFLLLLIASWDRLEDKTTAEKTIREGIAFILQFETEPDPEQERFSFFPFTIEVGQPLSIPNRLAWCYGDLNIALLLYRAGKLLEDGQYLALADKIGLRTLDRRSYIATQSDDSHFCHGSAGLAQFYKCLYEETGNKRYQEAYEYWIAETLELVDKNIAAQQYSVNPVSLLDGWSGVALVLADYISDKKQNWANVFLL